MPMLRSTTRTGGSSDSRSSRSETGSVEVALSLAYLGFAVLISATNGAASCSA